MEFIAQYYVLQVNRRCPVGHLQFAALKHCLRSKSPFAILPTSYGW